MKDKNRKEKKTTKLKKKIGKEIGSSKLFSRN